jgi:hypothetical protein
MTPVVRAAMTLLPRIRRKLRSTDICEPFTAMSMPAELDPEASQEIVEAAEARTVHSTDSSRRRSACASKAARSEIARVIEIRARTPSIRSRRRRS